MHEVLPRHVEQLRGRDCYRPAPSGFAILEYFLVTEPAASVHIGDAVAYFLGLLSDLPLLGLHRNLEVRVDLNKGLQYDSAVFDKVKG